MVMTKVKGNPFLVFGVLLLTILVVAIALYLFENDDVGQSPQDWSQNAIPSTMRDTHKSDFSIVGLAVESPSENTADYPELAYHDLPVSECTAEQVSYEDQQKELDWRKSHPDLDLQARMTELIIKEGWALATDESPEGKYAYSHMVSSCYGAPSTSEELQLLIGQLEKEVFESDNNGLEQTASALIKSYKEKYLFCQGRSFLGGEHIDIVRQAAEMKNEAALIDWTKNYLPQQEDADPITSLKFARYLEEALSEMTYDRALLIGRLYTESEVNKPLWHKQKFQEMINLRHGMAYYEMARRIMPAASISQNTDCAIMEDLLFQLHVAMSTNDVMEIEALSSALYDKWF